MSSPSLQLQIKHIGYQNNQNNEQNKPQFVVLRGSDLKSSAPVTLTGPDQTVCPGRPNSNLQQDLRWYLEKFLELPTGAYPDLAERVQDCLREWGKYCFETLFQKQAYLWLQEARQKGLENLHLKISSDDPRVLAWPWEALHDPETGTLAHHCRIERQINKDLNDPLPLPENLPKDRINILLVIARPGGDSDVGFHALSRPLVELTRVEQQMPVHIDVLRPPTFDRLRQQLHDKPGFYHIVHFDGHGGYGPTEDSISSDAFKSGAQGRLLFENEEAGKNPVEAAKLSELLAEYRIPIMVLNACQSARIDEQAEDAFASVAAALLKAGIRSVVAMGHSLYVSGAQQFVPAFYRRLLETANVAEAVRAGRQEMLAHDQRPCLLGEHPLQDWLVPVLYQQMQTDETVLARPLTATPAAGKFTLEEETAPDPLPAEAQQLGDEGFIGRQQAVQQLERARLQQEQAAFLIHGMAGVGKTTLAKGFLHWLRDTGGLEQQVTQQVFWFSFDEIRNAEFVINQLVDGIFGNENTNALAVPLEQKLAGLIKVFREHPFLLIWDNFESASGIAGTEVRPLLSEDDRGLLKELLAKLRGGKTKVLITSRSTEKWLATGECFRLPLSGLHGEELWQFCNQVLRDLGLRVKRDDEDFRTLIEELDGHPLALRTVLLQLQEKKPAQLLADLRKEFALLEGDESGNRILAALAVLDQGLPEEYGPVLQLIGLHRRFVDQIFLEQMLKMSEEASAAIQPCFALLETAGLVSDLGSNIFQLHPVLQTYLERQEPAKASLQRTFVCSMSLFANKLARKELHEQHIPFTLHQGSLHHALNLAHELDLDPRIPAALTLSLAAYSQNNRDYAGAVQFYESLVDHDTERQDRVEEITYHRLGTIASDHREFDKAKQLYKKSLAIKEKRDNEHGAAQTYHQLGMNAQKQSDFSTAEQWYKKALKIKEKQGDEYGAATTYHQLGRIAEEQQDFAVAEQWYKKALAIFEKRGNEYNMAGTCHQLGRIAEEQQDFAAAKQWYKKALAIFEKQGNEHGAALNYHQLGSIAEEQQDFAAAEQWYKKALAIFEKQGNKHDTAVTYYKIGQLAHLQDDYIGASEWYLKVMPILLRNKELQDFGFVLVDFIQTLQLVEQEKQLILRQKWQQAGLDQFNSLEKLEQQLNEQM